MLTRSRAARPAFAGSDVSELFFVDVLVLNVQTGEFQRNLDYLDAYFEGGRDVEVLTEQEFSVTVEQMRGVRPS